MHRRETKPSNWDELIETCRPDSEVPFPPEEFKARLDRVRARMAKDRIELLFVASPEGMNYLSGYQCEWYQAQSPKQWPASSGIAVHVDHDKFILFDTVREFVLQRYCTVSTDTRPFPPASMRDGISFILDELKAERWLPARVGLEYWSYRPNRALSQRFEAALRAAGSEVVDGSDVLREVRWKKSPAEMACIEEAGRIANIGLMAAKDAIAPGTTELEVYGAIVHAIAKAGGENPGITMPVLSGKKSNCLHALASRRKIGRGEIVCVDVSGVFKRYHANIARTFATGEPSKEIQAFAGRIARSMELMRNALRPNLPVRELNQLMMNYFIAEGLWEHRGWIGGYEMGIAFPPDWVGNFVFDPLSEINAERVFEPGTAVNYENQFVLPKAVGTYFTIDTLAFKDGEAKLLGTMPYEIQVVA